jgi:hypothetical protein
MTMKATSPATTASMPFFMVSSFKRSAQFSAQSRAMAAR